MDCLGEAPLVAPAVDGVPTAVRVAQVVAGVPAAVLAVRMAVGVVCSANGTLSSRMVRTAARAVPLAAGVRMVRTAVLAVRTVRYTVTQVRRWSASAFVELAVKQCG